MSIPYRLYRLADLMLYWERRVQQKLAVTAAMVGDMADRNCYTCSRNVGAGCMAMQQYPHDAGYDQPYCDGYDRKEN